MRSYSNLPPSLQLSGTWKENAWHSVIIYSPYKLEWELYTVYYCILSPAQIVTCNLFKAGKFKTVNFIRDMKKFTL